jgi:hypothetical protein
MNRIVRMMILMVGLVGACAPIAVPQVPALDGGSIPLCPPSSQMHLQVRCK